MFSQLTGDFSPEVAQCSLSNNTQTAEPSEPGFLGALSTLQTPAMPTSVNESGPMFFEVNSNFNPVASQVNQLADEVTPGLLRYLLSG